MSDLSTLDRARTERAPTDRAARIQPPSWRDSRLLVGVLLVLASIALGSYLVARADDSVPMYAAAGPLTPGQSLDESAVVRVDVRLADGVAGYLPADEPLPAEGVVLREVRSGELVPLSAVGTTDDAALSQVTIAVDATSAAALTSGTVVDVFVNLPVAGSVRDEYAGPERLLERVTVAAVDTSGRGLGGSGAGTAVRIMVPVEQVPDLIAAVDLQAKVTVVPVPGAVTRSGG
ncbi:hypothetical protein GA707_16660 [Nostocoides sp. F2B08]|uniref:hypothetical protein n=1 Tax=Nostocoides sp. F2B08 TaxID=2653936 RepID=UPI001262F461|nr:hypothetical protein [Tetrasphaera sp. F2B08]KAB7741846.1 hypothetical protein GA707_16660 [Tetrasphaera sp. F2B08]